MWLVFYLTAYFFRGQWGQLMPFEIFFDAKSIYVTLIGVILTTDGGQSFSNSLIKISIILIYLIKFKKMCI
jgi:hypothetical protein